MKGGWVQPFIILSIRLIFMLCLNNSLSGPFEQFSLNFTQGQGHTSMLWDLPFNLVSAQYLLDPLNDLFFL